MPFKANFNKVGVFMDAKLKGVKKTKSVLIIMLALILVFSFVGCGNKINSYNSKVLVSLDSLPEEYNLLDEEIRNDIKIVAVLKNASGGKTHKITLSESNDYEFGMPLMPGKYLVEKCYINNAEVSYLQVESAQEEIVITRNNTAELLVVIKNIEEFQKRMKFTKPSDEILAASIFDRKAQYNGKIIDLLKIQSHIKFTPPANTNVAPQKTYTIKADEDTSVSIIVQNQTKKVIPVQECTVTGVKFSGNNVVMPKNIHVGMNISQISHAKDGILGKPTKINGTPLIGMGLEYKETFVEYLDEKTGDKIIFEINDEKLYVVTIKYEFERYE